MFPCSTGFQVCKIMHCCVVLENFFWGGKAISWLVVNVLTGSVVGSAATGGSPIIVGSKTYSIIQGGFVLC